MKDTGYSCDNTSGTGPFNAGNAETQSCTEICGDGLIIGTETCDPGNGTITGCTSCSQDNGYQCDNTSGTGPFTNVNPETQSCDTVCGDGIIAGSETCDDGGATITGCD